MAVSGDIPTADAARQALEGLGVVELDTLRRVVVEDGLFAHGGPPPCGESEGRRECLDALAGRGLVSCVNPSAHGCDRLYRAGALGSLAAHVAAAGEGLPGPSPGQETDIEYDGEIAIRRESPRLWLLTVLGEERPVARIELLARPHAHYRIYCGEASPAPSPGAGSRSRWGRSWTETTTLRSAREMAATEIRRQRRRAALAAAEEAESP